MFKIVKLKITKCYINPEVINYNGLTFRVIPKREETTSKRSYMPSIPQSERPVTEEEMLCAILEKEHQMIVQRSNQREIPNITDAQLGKYFLPEHLETARKAVTSLTEHARAWSIIPKHNATTHDDSIVTIRPWREQMREKYGDLFVGIWRRNKVRPNAFQPAYGYLSTLPAYMRFSGEENNALADLIGDIAKRARIIMRVDAELNYAHLDNEVKLKVIEKFDRLVVKTLQILSCKIPEDELERYEHFINSRTAQNGKSDEDQDPLAKATK